MARHEPARPLAAVPFDRSRHCTLSHLSHALTGDGQLAGHSLIFSNKTPADVICEKELRHLLGERCILTLTRQGAPGYDRRLIDRDYLGENIQDFNQHFYVCGPPPFVEDIKTALAELGAPSDAVVFEK